MRACSLAAEERRGGGAGAVLFRGARRQRAGAGPAADRARAPDAVYSRPARASDGGSAASRLALGPGGGEVRAGWRARRQRRLCVVRATAPNDRIVLVRNPRYHDPALAIAAEEFIPLEDRSAAVRRFMAGEIDSYAEVPSDQIAYRQTAFPDALHLCAFRGTYYFAFNTSHAPFDDARVRRAFRWRSTAIFSPGRSGAARCRRPKLCAAGHSGLRAGHGDSTTSRRSAPTTAAQAHAWRRATGGGEPLKIEIRFNNRENHQATAIAVADMWRPLNVITSFVESDAEPAFRLSARARRFRRRARGLARRLRRSAEFPRAGSSATIRR